MYFASIEKRATIDRFLLAQKTIVPPKGKCSHLLIPCVNIASPI